MKIIRVYMRSGRVYEHEFKNVQTEEKCIDLMDDMKGGITLFKVSYPAAVYNWFQIERIAIEEVSDEEIAYKKLIGHKPWEK